MATRLLMVLFIIGAASLVACNATGQGVETAPLPTSTIVEERASAAAVQLLAATEMSATAEATLSVEAYPSPEAYPPPESPPVEATLSLVVPATPAATEMPFSYPVHTPFPTSTPFPAQPVAADQLPPLTHDLLFIQDATLMRWNHRASRIEPLFGPATASRRMPLSRPLAGPGVPEGGGVFGFTISPNAGWVIFTHYLSPEQSRIVTMNLETLETRVLAEAERLHAPALTADGRWAIYESVNIRTDESTLYYLATSGSGEGGPVGDCAAGETLPTQVCREGDALWILDSGEQTQVSLQPSCQGDHFFFYRRLTHTNDWSPSGRYRLYLIPGETEGSTTGLADTELGWELEIPGTYSYIIAQPETIWLRDGRLLKTADNVEVLHIEPESEDKLVLDRAIDFDVEHGMVISPIEFDDGRIGFALVLAIVYSDLAMLEFSPQLGLYLMDSAGGEPRQVNQLPPDTDRLLWVPDGSGALVAETHTDELLYTPTDGGSLYDLRPVIPETASCFAWVPNP